MTSRPPTNTREIQARGERALAAWVIFFLIVVGEIAIALVYGPGASLTGLICLGGGALVFAALYTVLTWLERWANKEDEEEEEEEEDEE